MCRDYLENCQPWETQKAALFLKSVLAHYQEGSPFSRLYKHNDFLTQNKASVCTSGKPGCFKIPNALFCTLKDSSKGTFMHKVLGNTDKLFFIYITNAWSMTVESRLSSCG